MAAPHQDDRFGFGDHWKVLCSMCLVAIATFSYGLDFGVVNGLQAMVPFLEVFGYPTPATVTGWNISTERQQLISSLMTLGAFLSSVTSGITSTYLGRKASLWVASVLVFISMIIQQTSEDIGAIYVARLIVGLGNGLLVTHGQLWIQECSPANLRGFGLTMWAIWTTLGTLVGTIVDNFASYNTTKSAYIIPLGIVYIAPGILSIGLIFIPESPRWLLTQGRVESAEKALRWLRPPTWDVSQEFAQIQTALEVERKMQSGVAILDLFSNPIDRRRTFLSIGAVLCQAACGSLFIIAFGTYFFTIAALGKPFQDSVVLLAVALLAILINAAIVTRWGYRRDMIIAGMLSCGLCELVIAATWTAQPTKAETGNVLVAFSVLYLFCYNLCIGSYAWMAGGEIPSQRLRSYTFGLACGVGFAGAWLITFTAPYFINPLDLNWGPKYCWIWFASCWVTAVWVFFFLPETKGRTLEELDEMFEAGISARAFRSYVCQGLGGSSVDENGNGNEKTQGEENVEA